MSLTETKCEPVRCACFKGLEIDRHSEQKTLKALCFYFYSIIKKWFKKLSS